MYFHLPSILLLVTAQFVHAPSKPVDMSTAPQDRSSLQVVLCAIDVRMRVLANNQFQSASPVLFIPKEEEKETQPRCLLKLCY